MNPVLTGALVMACVLAGLIFLRFWRATQDRFFACFAVSFWIQGAQWLYMGTASAASAPGEYSPYLYLPRLLAYGLIAFAILEKNYRPAD
jgi:hypothetical protein